MDKQWCFIIIALSCSGFCCFGANVDKASHADQADDVTKIQEAMTSVLERLHALEKKNARQFQEINRLTEENKHLIQKITQLDDKQKPPSLTRESTRTPDPDTRSQFTAFACTSANISLSCPSNRGIFLTGGDYGQYALSCSQSCCAPNPELDCTELVEENRPSDWNAIKALCDGQESCQFQNLGSTIDECEAGYLSDYMQLFYDCLPDDETGPVAFTAWAETGSQTVYNAGDVIIFDQILINLGGHYNPSTSSFICPVDGVYVASVNSLSYPSALFSAVLMRNDEFLAQAYADIVEDAYIRGSIYVIVECSRGDALWVTAVNDNIALHANDRRHSTFTAHLLHRL